MVGYIPASAVRVNGYNAYEDLTSAAVTYKLASNVGDISFAIVLGDEAWNADGAAADLVPDNIGGDELSAHWGTQADRFVADLPPFDVLLSCGRSPNVAVGDHRKSRRGIEPAWVSRRLVGLVSHAAVG
jgi:hypothetical protein